MSSAVRLILKDAGRVDKWESEVRGDYNLDRFEQEFRNRLYSDRGRELLEKGQAIKECELSAWAQSLK